MTDIVKEFLVRRAKLAEAALECSHAHSERPGNLRDGRTVSGNHLAESLAYIVGECARRVIMRERQLQPRHKNRQELGISMDHRESERSLVEDHEIVWRIEAELTAEVSPEDRLVRSTSGKLEASWLHRRHGSMLS